jgi:hypothetical protein
MFLGVCVVFAQPAQAQRSGFIIGFGLGPGLVGGDIDAKFGLAYDFHIGGVIGDVELAYVNKVMITGNEFVDAVVTGVSGVGVAYPLNSDFAITGAVGVGVYSIIDSDFDSDGLTGLGLLAGGRYKLNESGRWMLNFDIMYANPGDLSLWGAQVTINVMSH